ncbi:MAG: Nif3-like dinuclear metal center hexameric protein [Bacteroidetes bacterium]|nr:Nif3-like dinuclear metal center hexameric protein [Bacteroidota bacterium]MBU1720556.1 Nif3-like dinuclear metal center hexameric protein [Bacteroidota bacterium]
MTQISELAKFLDQQVPLALQEDYDNCGLITGEGNTELTAVLLTVDLTEKTIDEAIEKKCNLIISHHPPFLSGLKRFTGKQGPGKLITMLIRKDIALYVMHTNLDAFGKGVSYYLAHKMSLTDIRVLSPKMELLAKIVTFCPASHAEKVRSALFNAGAGFIGNYDECSYSLKGEGTFRAGMGANPFVGAKNKRHTEPEVRIETIFPRYIERSVIKSLCEAHPYEEPAYDIYYLANEWPTAGFGAIGNLPEPQSARAFLESVKKKLNLQHIRYSSLPRKKLKRVAVCGGSGGILIQDAIRAGADIFLTADIKYHSFFETSETFAIADIGHYESEQFSTQSIFDIIQKKFSTFAVRFTRHNTNPVHYM